MDSSRLSTCSQLCDTRETGRAAAAGREQHSGWSQVHRAKRFIILTWRWECVNWMGQLFVFISSAARLIVSNELHDGDGRTINQLTGRDSFSANRAMQRQRHCTRH